MPRNSARFWRQPGYRDFHRALAEKLLTFSVGRGIEYYDAPTIDKIVSDTENRWCDFERNSLWRFRECSFPETSRVTEICLPLPRVGTDENVATIAKTWPMSGLCHKMQFNKCEYLPSSLFQFPVFSHVSVRRKNPTSSHITDDHGWPDIGAVGIYDDLKTPHIDQLAADGVRCTSGYVTAPQCVPSRGGLLAGRDQSRFGLETNGSSLDGFNAEQIIAERLKNAGYATGQIGKWHLGPVQEISNHGFDDVFAKNSNRPGFANYGIDGSDQAPGKEGTKMYHLDACSAAATAFIDRHAEESFFLYLAYRAPMSRSMRLTNT